MENAELIKALKEDAEWAHGNEWETPITLGDHLDAAADRLEAAEKRIAELEAAQRWIPCAERLPKKEQENQQRGFYLVALENGVVKELAFEFDHYENMLFDPGWHDTAYPVTHWQKLPQPPQKG